MLFSTSSAISIWHRINFFVIFGDHSNGPVDALFFSHLKTVMILMVDISCIHCESITVDVPSITVSQGGNFCGNKFLR